MPSSVPRVPPGRQPQIRAGVGKAAPHPYEGDQHAENGEQLLLDGPCPGTHERTDSGWISVRLHPFRNVVEGLLGMAVLLKPFRRYADDSLAVSEKPLGDRPAAAPDRSRGVLPRAHRRIVECRERHTSATSPRSPPVRVPPLDVSAPPSLKPVMSTAIFVAYRQPSGRRILAPNALPSSGVLRFAHPGGEDRHAVPRPRCRVAGPGQL
jgi:hypothetical protein